MKIEKPKLNIIEQFKRLEHTATALNESSDKLGEIIELFEHKLKAIHLGVSAWCSICKTTDGERFIGYSRISGSPGGKAWHLALQIRHTDASLPVESWAFNDAPRWLRLEGIAHLPNLIETLIERSETMMKQVEKNSEKMSAVLAEIEAVDVGAGAGAETRTVESEKDGNK